MHGPRSGCFSQYVIVAEALNSGGESPRLRKIMNNLLTEYFELCPNGICLDLLTEREKQEVAK